MRSYLFIVLLFNNFVVFSQDVIIKKTGELINGKVLEVGIDQLKYRRGDQNDGPVYTIPLRYVYAVSYADRTQDIFTKPDSTFLKPFLKDLDTIAKPSFIKSDRSYAYLGIGLIKDYTKINADANAQQSIKIPFLFMAYALELRPSLMLGIEMGYSNYELTGRVNDQYDNFSADYLITESIFSGGIFAKKNFWINPKISPYLKIGFGINSSQINLQSNLDLDQRGRRNLLVQSAGNITGLGILGRVGIEYYFSESAGAFIDVGLGTMLVQMGGVFSLPSPIKQKKQNTQKPIPQE